MDGFYAMYIQTRGVGGMRGSLGDIWYHGGTYMRSRCIRVYKLGNEYQELERYRVYALRMQMTN